MTIVSIVGGNNEDDYLITLSNGNVVVVDGISLNVLDLEDGTDDGCIDVSSAAFIDAISGDGISMFTSNGQNFSVNYGPDINDYIITLADGSVLVTDSTTLTTLDGEDGTTDGIINVDDLVANENVAGINRFVSGTNQDFVVKAGVGLNDYFIEFTNGPVIAIDSKTFNQLDAEDGATNNSIDVDNLVDGTSGDNISQFFSGTGQNFSVEPGPGEDDYLISVGGNVVAIDGVTLVALDAEDGVSGSGTINVDSLVDGTSNDNVSQFFSGSGQSFTVTAGSFEDSYLITLQNGTVVAVAGPSLSQLDGEDGVSNSGTIDVDNLVDGVSSDNIALFMSSSNQNFTVAPGSNSNDYLITLQDGSVIVADQVTLSQLDLEDGMTNGQIDVDNLVDGDSGDRIVHFVSGGGQSFSVDRGPLEDDYLVTLANGSVISIDDPTLTALDGKDGSTDGVVDIDAITNDPNDSEVRKFFSSIVCFTPYSVIETAEGLKSMAELKVGDKIQTKDNGYQPLRWIYSRDLTTAELIQREQFAPVLIQKGSLGNGLPERHMLVSPGHMMLANNRSALRVFKQSEALLPAHQLAKTLDGVDVVMPRKGITYIHLLFDRHEIVKVDGTWTESFRPGKTSLRGLGARRNEVYEIFPELRHKEPESVIAPVRESFYNWRAKRLARRVGKFGMYH